MSQNPYCILCFQTLGLNDGFDPEVCENVEIDVINNFGKEGHICKNCLCKLVIKYNNKYEKQLNVLF